ncbi:hypothetical protein DFH07DRAFT_774442 [Mycena maculata]|uniref:Uncharacterized protein n=1 Tax=Mycena maculata TaxID=230809 RepID=A0AAD7N9K2_9AGAR|nr:hypothetical protein DFH07DRAFT_774442 [Mycena maculata]
MVGICREWPGDVSGTARIRNDRQGRLMNLDDNKVELSLSDGGLHRKAFVPDSEGSSLRAAESLRPLFPIWRGDAAPTPRQCASLPRHCAATPRQRRVNTAALRVNAAIQYSQPENEQLVCISGNGTGISAPQTGHSPDQVIWGGWIATSAPNENLGLARRDFESARTQIEILYPCWQKAPQLTCKSPLNSSSRYLVLLPHKIQSWNQDIPQAIEVSAVPLLWKYMQCLPVSLVPTPHVKS